MKPVSEKDRDAVMRFFIDRYFSNLKYAPIYFSTVHDECTDIEATSDQVILVLMSSKDIQYEEPRLMDGSGPLCLTTKGFGYFERKEDEEKRLKREYKHDIKVALISAVAGALLSAPLWSLIRSIASIFF